MKVAVLVLDGVFDTGLAAVVDTLAIADELTPSSQRPFSAVRVGVRRRVTTGQGLTVPLVPPPRRPPDLVVVPALSAKSPELLDAALARKDVRDATELLGEWSSRGARVAAACTGTFVVARAKLLDGQHATTTWWLAPAFRERFPAVKLDESRMLVEGQGVVTAGAALAHLDLALHLVRRASPSLARVVARHLAYDRRPSQGAYVMPDHLAHADPLVERFEAWARKNLTTFAVADAARAVGASERTLERRVRRVLGKSPVSYVQDLRVQDAVLQLETTDRGIDEIATRVGYQDGVTLRTLLRKKTGLGVRELRARG